MTTEITRRTLVAMLGIVPAALALPATPLSNLEKLVQRLERDRVINFSVTWGPEAASLTVEERAGVLLEALDAAADPVEDIDGDLRVAP